MGQHGKNYGKHCRLKACERRAQNPMSGLPLQAKGKLLDANVVWGNSRYSLRRKNKLKNKNYDHFILCVKDKITLRILYSIRKLPHKIFTVEQSFLSNINC